MSHPLTSPCPMLGFWQHILASLRMESMFFGLLSVLSTLFNHIFLCIKEHILVCKHVLKYNTEGQRISAVNQGVRAHALRFIQKFLVIKFGFPSLFILREIIYNRTFYIPKIEGI